MNAAPGFVLYNERITAMQGRSMIGLEARCIGDASVRIRLHGRMEAVGFNGDVVLPKGRKAQAILAYLALSSGEPIPRQRLVELLWSARWGEQGRASLRQCVLELRSAFRPPFDDLLTVERDFIRLDTSKIWIDGVSQRAGGMLDRGHLVVSGRSDFLETLLGLDSKFDEWVRHIRSVSAGRLGGPQVADDAPGELAATIRSEAAARGGECPRGLSLVVAPVLEVGGAFEDGYLAQALTQELVTALARFRWIRVRLSPLPVSDDQYVLESYLTEVIDGWRLVLRLIDQRDRGVVLWTKSARIQSPLQPPMVEQIVEQVIQELDPEILSIETRRVLQRSVASPNSYECVLRAIPLIYCFDEASWRRASDLLDQAIRSDPQHGRAYAFSALCRATGLAQGWSKRPELDFEAMDQEASRAIDCDPRDSLALALSAHLRSFLHHDFDAARQLFDRAIRANPSCGFAWGYSSLTYAYTGCVDEAMDRLIRAQSIMIHDPFSSFMDSFYAVITYFSKNWPETIETCRSQLKRRPAFTNIRKLLIGALCSSGDLEQARLEHRRLIMDEPDFSWSKHLATYPFGRKEDRDELEAALRRAGFAPNVAAHPGGGGLTAGRRGGAAIAAVSSARPH